MADRRCLRHVSVVVGTLVVAAGMSSCTQSMPVPAKPSAAPTSSATNAASPSGTATTTTASTAETSTSATSTTTSSTDSSATTSTSSGTSSTSSSTPTTATTASGAGAPAPKVIVGDSVLTAEGPVQCTDDSNGTRTIEVGSGTVYTAQVTSDENFSVVKMDLGVVDGVPMQVRASGGSVAAQGHKSENSYIIVGTAQGTDPSTNQVVQKDFTFEATCP
jgi:Mycobacterium 19 kDa lipoprotein antigen